jgi:dolichol-phosphate mannosyltransferase
MPSNSRQLTVVVPTYAEQENIRPLTERLFKACKAENLIVDLLFMDDDSGEGTRLSEEIVKELQKTYPVRIYVRRKGSGEGKGLSSAVVLGFEKAKYECIMCMDADLQHEPEAVPSVAAPVLNGSAEFTVGSRNVAGGGIGMDWALHRRILSSGATMLAWPVASSTDPMSGFFCTTRTVFNRGKKVGLNATGFKIGLELMARSAASPVVDVPITFRERVAGESKLSMSQNIDYVLQLMALYWARYKVLMVLIILIGLYVLKTIAKYAGLI